MDGVRALAVGVVSARDLHQARGRTASIGVAGGLLHGDEGQDCWVDAMTVSGFLKVRVILLAGASGIGVEFWAVDVVKACEVKEWRVPAIASEACVEPVFRPSKES